MKPEFISVQYCLSYIFNVHLFILLRFWRQFENYLEMIKKRALFILQPPLKIGINLFHGGNTSKHGPKSGLSVKLLVLQKKYTVVFVLNTPPLFKKLALNQGGVFKEHLQNRECRFFEPSEFRNNLIFSLNFEKIGAN